MPLVDLTTVAAVGEGRARAAADRYRAQDARRTIRAQFDGLWEDYAAGKQREQLVRQKVAASAKAVQYHGELKWTEPFVTAKPQVRPAT